LEILDQIETTIDVTIPVEDVEPEILDEFIEDMNRGHLSVKSRFPKVIE